MIVSSVSSTDSMAGLVSQAASGEVQGQIALSVVKQNLEQQKQQGEAIVRMINQASSLASTGQHIDIRV